MIPNGPGRSPIEEDRHLGFTSREFDHSGWDAATVIGTVQHGIEVAAFILSIDPATIQDRLQQSLPITDVPLLCAQEIDVPGSMPRVLRLLAHVETSLSRHDLRHVVEMHAVRQLPFRLVERRGRIVELV